MIKFKELPFKKENVWITSDIHGFHTNMAKGVSNWESGYRDFNDQFEMTNHIVDNINKHVQKDDLLIHCGDWTFGGKDNIAKLRKMINCKNIINIEGNHDHNIKKVITDCPFFEDNEQKNTLIFLEHVQLGYYKVEDFSFMCSHYPMLIWHQSHKSVPLAFGHVHGSNSGVGKSIDVGIDNIFKLTGEYKPINLKTFEAFVSNKEIYLESHHNLKTN